MYNFGSLITATLYEKDPNFIARLEIKLLETEEKEAVDFILGHVAEFEETPSLNLAKTTNELFDFVDPVKPKDCIATVFDLAVDWLIARRGMNVIADIQETYAVNGKFPVIQFLGSAQFLGGISKQENISLNNVDLDSVYGDVLEGAKLGFEIIDEQSGGILPGELAIIASRPGIGKTEIVCDQAVRNARIGKRVMIFSLEMSERHLTHRLHGIIGSFNPKIFRMSDPESNKKRWNFRHIVDAELSLIRAIGGNIIWPKKQLVTMAQIEAEVKENDPDIVIVDGMYLIPSANAQYKKNWEVIGEHSNKLKQMALTVRDEGIPIFATTQINRSGAIDPKLEHLAFGDAIGQDADLALSLSKPDGATGIVVNIMKSRHGPTFGSAELHIDWNKSKITEKKLSINEDRILIGKSHV